MNDKFKMNLNSSLRDSNMESMILLLLSTKTERKFLTSSTMTLMRLENFVIDSFSFDENQNQVSYSRICVMTFSSNRLLISRRSDELLRSRSETLKSWMSSNNETALDVSTNLQWYLLAKSSKSLNPLQGISNEWKYRPNQRLRMYNSPWFLQWWLRKDLPRRRPLISASNLFPPQMIFVLRTLLSSSLICYCSSLHCLICVD